MDPSSIGYIFQGLYVLFYCWRDWHILLGYTFACTHCLMGFIDGIWETTHGFVVTL
jgi:hypothetical protein